MASKKRRAIRPSLRFEVFKRDSFTCQYCGAKAPDVVLEVDHIDPVSKGGGNELMNLLTACSACNGGKGARRLDDSSVVAKQRAQLEELEERRAQLAAMLEWRDGLSEIAKDSAEAVVRAFEARAVGWTTNGKGAEEASRWVRRWGLGLVLDAVDASCDSYLRLPTSESVNKAWEMVPRVAAIKAGGDEDVVKHACYARAILRNNGVFVEARCISICKKALRLGLDPEELKVIAREARSFLQFERDLADAVGEGHL